MNKIILPLIGAATLPFIIYKIKEHSNGKQCKFKPNLD